jgi:Tfp pilus assembly protein PilF
MLDFYQIALQPADPSRYSGVNSTMIARFAACLALIAAVSVSSAAADVRTDAKAQVAFGMDVAQRGLWREAIYRWEKAVQIDPTYAAAFNDLAVAYEHEGQLDKARQAYEKAIALEPNNTQIRQNYDLFKEINDRAGAAKEKP